MDTIPQDNVTRKQCSNPDCRQWFPATTEFFYPDNRRKDDFKNPCKSCLKKRANRPEIREKRLAYMQAYHKSHEGRERDRISYAKPENREKKHIRDRERRIRPEVKEKMSSYEKAYRSRPGVRDRERARHQAYYSRPEIQEKRQIWREGYRERNRLYLEEYKKRPGAIERFHVARSKRRARLRQVAGTHTPEQLREQYDRQKGTCYYCHTRVVWGKHHFDHVVPLSRGGSNDISNIVIACAFCNLSKNDRLPHEWIKGGRLL